MFIIVTMSQMELYPLSVNRTDIINMAGGESLLTVKHPVPGLV